MIKRCFLSLLLCGVLVLAFTACKGPDAALTSSVEETVAPVITSSEASSEETSSHASSEPASSALSSKAASSQPADSSAVSSQAQAKKKPSEAQTVSDQSAVPEKQKAVPPPASSSQASIPAPGSEAVSSQPVVTSVTHCTGTAGSVEQKLFQKINDKRTELGLSALAWDDTYHTAANIRTNELPTLYEHRRPDGRDWSSIFEELGLPSYPGRENLIYAGNAAVALDEDQVVAELYTGWVTSQGHYENLTAADVNVSGLCVLYTDTDIYATQLFGHK